MNTLVKYQISSIHISKLTRFRFQTDAQNDGMTDRKKQSLISGTPFFIYGIIQFGPNAGFAPVV